MPSLIIDDFEYANLPTSFNDGTQDFPLWHYDNNLAPASIPVGSTSLSTTESFLGSQSLQITANGDGSSPFAFQALYFNNFGSGGVNDWRYVRQNVAGYDQFLTYNRIRFVMKPPAAHTHLNNGWNNLHFGTYNRSTTTNTQQNESDNAHYYHYFDAGYSGGWQQFIIDPHVHHQRGSNQEHGVLADGFLEAGYNYFDLMTWFYFESQFTLNSTQSWFVDRVEFLQVTEDEDLTNIYAVNAYLSEINANELVVRWSRSRDFPSETYDVRYAFTSFYDNGGFTHGTAAPNGTAIQSIAAGDAPYTACVWSTDQIDITGQDVIYIAIKHETEATRFREVAIPLTVAGRSIVFPSPTAVAEITENGANPLPASITLAAGESYDFNPHLTVPNGVTPNFALSDASGPLSSGVTLSTSGIVENNGSDGVPFDIEIDVSET